jgi:hypothetical protein
MAINIPIVTEFVDAGLKSAQGAFDNFRTKVGEADGSLNKLKAGGAAAFDGIKANAASMAAGAGAAIAGFALKAIGDFQDLALEVDKFSNATGLAAEEASRWIEAAGDIGVESNTLITAFNRLNRAVGDNSAAFGELGVEIVKTADGATDVNATFLKTVDALGKVNDPAQRARLATQLLGKSWTELSEMVEMGADELTAALEGVGEAKVIDEREIQKAKDLRAAQDALGDAIEEFTIAVGVTLAPILTKFTEQLADIAGHADTVGRIFKVVAGAVTKDMELMAEGITGNSKAAAELSDSMRETVRKVYALSLANEEATSTLEDVDDALTELKGNVDRREAWRNLVDEIDKVKDAAIEAFVEGTPASIRESESALDRLRVELGEYIIQTEGIPTEKKTDFLARLETANLQEIEAIFNQLGRPRTVTFVPTVSGIPIGPGETPSEVLGRRSLSLAGRPGVGNVTVNVAGSVVTERDLVNSVRKGLIDSQRNGAPLVYSNS